MTVDLYEGIMTTRAIRRYTDEPVTDAEIERCLAAAMQAPSGGNTQPWQFVVAQAPQVRDSMAAIYQRAFTRWEAAQRAQMPQFRTDQEAESFERGLKASRVLAGNVSDAQALVLFVAPRITLGIDDADGFIDIGPIYASVYPAVQNFMLAARSQGIGTVLTTVWWSEQAAIRELFGFSERHEAVALIPMGRPRGSFGQAPRRHYSATTHWDRWGNKRQPD